MGRRDINLQIYKAAILDSDAEGIAKSFRIGVRRAKVAIKRRKRLEEALDRWEEGRWDD